MLNVFSNCDVVIYILYHCKFDLNNEHENIIFRSNFSYTFSDSVHEHEGGKNVNYIIDRFVIM